MIAAIYSRKSKFTGKGESIENQIKMCKEYGEHLNINEFIIYEDEGFSGGNTNRPKFQELIKDAKAKKFNTLICYRLDRISRNVADFSTTLELLKRYKISFVSITERFDTSTPVGEAMVYIASVFAQLERATIAERVKDNMLQLAKTGRWLGGKTPTGFKSEEEVYYDEQMNKRKMFKLSPIQEELNLVSLIYEKYLELGSLTKLESYCLSNNIKSKNGNDFDKSALKFILTNPVYVIADELIYDYCIDKNMIIGDDKSDFNGKCSIMAFNKRKVTKGNKVSVSLKSTNEWIIALSKHKGIIDSKVWIDTQNQLHKNKNKAPREGTSRHALLTPLLTCANCGSKLRVVAKYKDGKMQYHYYKCLLKNNSNGTRCSIQNLNGIEAEKLVIEEIKKIALEQSKISKSLLNKQSKLKNASSDIASKKKSLNKKLKECEENIENLTEQLTANQKSTAAKYIVKKIEKIDAEIIDIQEQLNSLETKAETNKFKELNNEILNQNIKIFAEEIDTLDFDRKKKLLHSIVKEITWDGEELKIKILGVD